MHRAVFFAAIAAGITVAVWHATIAMTAIFLFRNNEPFTSWLAVGLGPLLTVIGCAIALFHRLTGGAVVLAGGLLSAVAFLIGERGVTESLAPYLLKFTAPVLVVGAVLLLLSQRSASEDKRHAS